MNVIPIPSPGQGFVVWPHNALEYRLQGANAKKLDLSTCIDNSNANMPQ